MCQPLLLSLKIFHTRKFLKHRRVPLRTISVPWDNKNFEGKSWHRPLSSSQNFSIPESSWKTEGFLYEKFRHSERHKFLKHKKESLRNHLILWDKTISTENRDTRYLFYQYFFSDTRNIVKRRNFPLGTALVLWDKEVSTENRDRRPSFVTMKFFDTKMFPEHRKVRLRNVMVLWDQKVSMENRDTRPLSFLNIF